MIFHVDHCYFEVGIYILTNKSLKYEKPCININTGYIYKKILIVFITFYHCVMLYVFSTTTYIYDFIIRSKICFTEYYNAKMLKNEQITIILGGKLYAYLKFR